MAQIVSLLPDSWGRYFEPFAGGLALLTELGNRNLINTAAISDINNELINFYLTVKEQPEELVRTISEYGFSNERTYYYRCRAKFNEITGNKEKQIERAAIFLYLNRHGYNGLWRVNSEGMFNVPFGKYTKPAIPSPEHIMQFSKLLREVHILEKDFVDTVCTAEKGDFVYFDPPYQPVSGTAYFTDYNPGGFGNGDQKRLFETCIDLDERGVKFLLSNSFSKKMTELYKDFHCYRIGANRNINSNAARRKGHFELLVTNQSAPYHENLVK